MTKTFYDILYLTPEAPAQVLTAVYRILAHKYHPDKNHSNPAASMVMRVINEAYSTLRSPAKRLSYNKDYAIICQSPLTTKHDKEGEQWQSLWQKHGYDIAQLQQNCLRHVQSAQAAPPAEKYKWIGAHEAAEQQLLEIQQKAQHAFDRAVEAFMDADNLRLQLAPKQYNYYSRLTICPNAPPDIVSAAYNAHAQAYTSSTPYHHAQRMLLDLAHQVLVDREKRQVYNRTLHVHFHDASTDSTQSEKERQAARSIEEAQSHLDALKNWQREITDQLNSITLKINDAENLAAQARPDSRAWMMSLLRQKESLENGLLKAKQDTLAAEQRLQRLTTYYEHIIQHDQDQYRDLTAAYAVLTETE